MRKLNKTTQQYINCKLITDARSGQYTMKELIEKYDMRKTSILRILKRETGKTLNELKNKPKKMNKTNNLDRIIIYNKYQLGISAKTLAQTYKVNTSRIYQIIREVKNQNVRN